MLLFIYLFIFTFYSANNPEKASQVKKQTNKTKQFPTMMTIIISILECFLRDHVTEVIAAENSRHQFS